MGALEERLRLLESEMYSGEETVETVKMVRQEHSIQHDGRRQQQQHDPIETMQHHEVTESYQVLGGGGVLTPGAKKQAGVETLILEQAPQSGVSMHGQSHQLGVGKLPSIIQCSVNGEAGRVEVEQIPRIRELAGHEGQAVEIASVQDPETGATRQYIVTQMSDSTSKQNLETIVEAIRHLEGDHLFSEESGPHQVVKEEVVESCIIEDNGQISNVVEMTLPNNCFTTTNIINSLPQLPQIPVSTYQLTLPSSLSLPLSASLPTVPVASLQQSTQMIPVSVSNLVSSLQQPLPQATFLPQVPVSSLSHSLPPVSTLSGSLPSLPIELGHIHPPQTSPVNLELGPSSGHSGSMSHTGSVTPNSELSNSPPQSSPVNLAQPPLQHLEN